MEGFKKLIEHAPNKPGVYNFIDINGNVIYVGKAIDLRKRLLSYTRNVAYKTHIAVSKTVSVVWTVCNNETEALLLESSQVKEIQPRYNVLLKDDKTFPEIFIDTSHEFPAIRYHRGVHKLKGKYFGPFPSPKHVKSVIDIVKKTTMIRGCADGDFATRKRP